MLTTLPITEGKLRNMTKVVKIHQSKQPPRPHYIGAWMERRGVIAADVARDTNIDKSSISRWVKTNATPDVKNQEILAAYFGTDREGLFRDPADDWMRRMFQRRKRLAEMLASMSDEDLDRAENVIQAAFPQVAKAH